MQSLIGALVSAGAIALLLFPRTALGLSFLVTILAFGLAYEWTHYLVHTDYRPKRALYRAIWRNHRLHHFKNEHYWFAVTTPGTADRVLRTYPIRPRSPPRRRPRTCTRPWAGPKALRASATRVDDDRVADVDLVGSTRPRCPG